MPERRENFRDQLVAASLKPGVGYVEAAVYTHFRDQLVAASLTQLGKVALIGDIEPSPGHSFCESKLMATRRSGAASERPHRTATYAVVQNARAREGSFNFGKAAQL